MLAQAQADRDALSKDNDAFRKSLIDKRASNEGLKGKVDTTNSSVAKLREALTNSTKIWTHSELKIMEILADLRRRD